MAVGGPHISPVLWLRKIFRPNLASSANVLSKCVTLARLPDASCNFSFEIHRICSLALQPASNHLNTLQLTTLTRETVKYKFVEHQDPLRFTYISTFIHLYARSTKIHEALPKSPRMT